MPPLKVNVAGFPSSDADQIPAPVPRPAPPYVPAPPFPPRAHIGYDRTADKTTAAADEEKDGASLGVATGVLGGRRWIRATGACVPADRAIQGDLATGARQHAAEGNVDPAAVRLAAISTCRALFRRLRRPPGWSKRRCCAA